MDKTDTNDILAILERVGAIITESHVVYTSGRHGSTYVNKDALYAYPVETSTIAERLAQRFRDVPIDVVAGPSVGGVIIAQWLAYHLTQMTGRTILALYAEQEGVTGHRIFRRGYADLLPGKNVLVAEDILTTGGSARKVIRAVQGAGGTVVGLGALCNRGSVTQEALGVPLFSTLVDVRMEAWEPSECPLCQAGVPINTRVGKGAAFVARR